MIQTSHPKHTYVKGKIYYFSRYIPKDLRRHYKINRLVVSLRTSSRAEANLRARSISVELDKTWLTLRLQNDSKLLESITKPETKEISSTDTLSDCLDRYLRIKGIGKPKAFAQSSTRAVNQFISYIGNSPIDMFGSAEASKYREHLLNSKLKTASVRRQLACIRAILNFNIKELGLNIKNPFNNLYIPPTVDSSKRIPIAIKDIKRIQNHCFKIDDDIRHLIALLSDTGMRLAEAAGLLISDINLDTDTPCVTIQHHSHRRLKTLTSERCIPLVGASLWAAKRIIATQTSRYCFPRYNKESNTNSNSASAILNKWLKLQSSNRYVIHGFRHAMRDRLRAVETPLDMIDSIGGWAASNIGSKYGNGYTLNHTKQYMQKATVSTPD